MFNVVYFGILDLNVLFYVNVLEHSLRVIKVIPGISDFLIEPYAIQVLLREMRFSAYSLHAVDYAGGSLGENNEA